MPVLKAKYNGEWINVSGGGSGGGPSVQSDWNQNDPTQLDYIKNRTHYDEGQPYEISIFNQENMNFVEKPNIDGTGTMNIYTPEPYEEEIALENLQFTVENTYTIIIDGTSYSAQAKSLSGPNFTYIGNLSLATSVYPNTNENFLIIPSEGVLIINDSNNSHNITIIETRLAVKKEIVSQNTYSFSLESDINYLNTTDFDFSSLCDGNLLIVNYNGQEYSCNVTAIDGLGFIFGNGSMFGFDTEWHNEPFTGMYVQGMSGIYVYPTAIPFRIEKIISDTETEIIISEDTPYSAYIDDRIYYDFSDPSSFVIEPETSYKIFWNNIEYIGTSSTASDYGNITLEPDSEGDIPFVFEYCNNENELYAYFGVFSGGPEVLNEQIQINGLLSGVKKLDKKYIPNDIDLPVASYNKVGVVKVRGTQSGLGSNSNYTPIYLDTNDNQIYAKARSSMSTLTFTGATSGSYNGSSPVTINIPTALKNPNALTFTGGVTGTYDGSSAKTVAIPTALKNPNALTFTGGVTGTYDGSSAKTVAIPTALKNPYSLTFSGAVSGSYNGSSSKSVYIPTVPSSLKNPYSLTFTGGSTESYDGSSAKTVEIPIVPTSLKNPNALTFTGLIEGSYDGSEAVTIEIPTGVPEVTTDNNGQILQVVDGTWVNNNPVFNYTAYIDQGNGYKYYVYIYNGEQIIQAECIAIEVTTMPTKMIYMPTEDVNTAGMVVTATYADGSTKEVTNYTTSSVLTIDNPTVTVIYSEFDKSITTTFNVTIDDSEFVDFAYTVNNDNDVVLDTWNGTLNGEESTKCVIPDGNGIIDIII